MSREIPVKRNRFIVNLEDEITKDYSRRFIVYYQNTEKEVNEIFWPFAKEYLKGKSLLYLPHTEIVKIIDVDKEEKFVPDYLSAQSFISLSKKENMPKLIKDYRTFLNSKKISHDEIRYEFTKETLFKFDQVKLWEIEAES